MFTLGHEIGRTTVRRILAEDGIEPARERRKHMPWATFLKAHWGAIAAMDCFKVEVMTWTGPVRYSVLVIVDLRTRNVQVAGIVREAYEKWTMQVLRNLTDAVDGFLLGKTHLIMDRDPIFTVRVRQMLLQAGTKSVRLPRRSPNLNAFIERFIRSIKEECLDRVVPLGEAHLQGLTASTLPTTTSSARIRVLAVHSSSRPAITHQKDGSPNGSDWVACSTTTTEKPRDFGTIQ
jgi:putative transposase